MKKAEKETNGIAYANNRNFSNFNVQINKIKI